MDDDDASQARAMTQLGPAVWAGLNLDGATYVAINGRGYSSTLCTMRALQMDRLQRRRDLADGCKGLSSGSPLPMEFHSSSNVVFNALA